MKKKSQIDTDYFMRTHMGQTVVFKKKFERQRIKTTDATHVLRTTKVWVPVDLPAPRSGRIVGVRYLQTGYTKPGTVGLFRDDDEAPEFVETAPRQLAVLISINPLHNPIPVPPDSVHLMFTTTPIRLKRV